MFISASPEYAVEAYEVNAFYYLTKPLDAAKFKSVLEKCIKRIASLDNSYVNLKAVDGFSKIYLKEIVYCFTSGHKITGCAVGREPDRFIYEDDGISRRLRP